jgi:hypothetical protein
MPRRKLLLSTNRQMLFPLQIPVTLDPNVRAQAIALLGQLLRQVAEKQSEVRDERP